MANGRKPRAVKRIHIPLASRKYVTCVIWRNERDMYDGTMAADAPRDFSAIFVQEKKGNCIGRIHLHRGDLATGTIAHEVRHAIDYYHHRMHSEFLAQMSDRCVEMICEAAEDIASL